MIPSTSAVPSSDTTIEPRQPRLLEKKTNIVECAATGVPGALAQRTPRLAAGRHGLGDALSMVCGGWNNGPRLPASQPQEQSHG